MRISWIYILLLQACMHAQSKKVANAFSVIPPQIHNHQRLITSQEESMSSLRYSLGLEPIPDIVRNKPDSNVIQNNWLEDDDDEEEEMDNRKKRKLRQRWFFRKHLRSTTPENDDRGIKDFISSKVIDSSIATRNDGALITNVQNTKLRGSMTSYPGQQQLHQDTAPVATIEEKPHAGKDTATSSPWSLHNLQECATLWELTPDETIKLQTLKDKLHDIDHPKNDPYEVVRFLKEYNGNVVTAERNFRRMIQWRIKNDIDSILQEEPPTIQKYFPAGVLAGVDHDGDPIHLERTGAADTSNIYQTFGHDAMYHHAIWLREVQSNPSTEWQKQYEQKYSRKVRQFTIIMDMGGLSRKNMSPSLITLGQEVSRMVQDDYPGFTKRMIFVRSPAIFRFAFNAFKPFIDDNMKERIVFVNGGEELEKYLDTSVLPKELCPENGRGQSVEEFNTNWEGRPMR